jgi:hypothetical protein
MIQRAKTIQIYLPSGDAQGLRIAEVTTRIVQTIEVPRSKLEDFVALPESSQVGIYFLFGRDEDKGDRLYIGQSGDLRGRLTAHHKQKDFWQRALVWVSRTNSLTQTHALYLEWACLQAAARAGRYALENGNEGSKPHTPAPLEADCQEIFETGATLAATLGFPMFDAYSGRTEPSPERVYHCTAAGADARGLYTEEGFVVLKGSIGRRSHVKSLPDSSVRMRERLVASGVVVVEGERIMFPKDHLFGSPSTAGIVVLGRSSNGWDVWKLADGRTLDEVERGGATT